LAGEALSHVQSESLKGGAAVTAVGKLPGHQHLAGDRSTAKCATARKGLDEKCN